MAVTGQPEATTHQVGGTVYYIENNVPVKGEVSGTISNVTDTNSDNTAEVVITYELVGKGTTPYNSSRLYASGSALKTAFGSLVDALDA